MKRFISPLVATQLINECAHDNALMRTLMRPIRQHHVSYLARQIQRRNFGNNIIDVATCEETGQRFIVNGNHTLRAIIEADMPLRLTMEQTSCATMDDVRRAYSQYDRGLSRNRADAFRPLHSVADSGISLGEMGRLASAVAFIIDDYKTTGGSSRKSKMIGDADLYEEAMQWGAEYLALKEIVGGSRTWQDFILHRRGVVSVALVTLRANEAKAVEFWTQVVKGANMKDNAPALRLRDYLMTTAMHGGGAKGNKELAHADAVARTVAYCWGKHINGQALIRLTVPAGPVVVRFAST